MAAVTIFLCFFVLIIVETNGKRYRTPCQQSYLFRCNNGSCIHKHEWCNGKVQCSDGSDENYCDVWITDCKEDIHFICENGDMCIPREGYCDGYSSCPDQSDEKNCPCEEIDEREENIQYEAFIDVYRTQQKCWKIPVNKAQHLDLRIHVLLANRDCVHGNVSIYSYAENTSHEHLPDELICPRSRSSGQASTFTNKSLSFNNDVFIRYRSNYYIPNGRSYKDFLNITFKKIDVICNRLDAFKCSEYFCISPEKQCDGQKDCENGRDEENCDYGVLSAAYLSLNRVKAIQWIRSQHNADWGWKHNTHRAIVSLYLANDTNFSGTNKDDELTAKQLELELFTYLLRNKFEKISSSELASYISALLVICHNPRNFYGHDLIDVLTKNMKTDLTYIPPFLYLTLCNAKEPISEDDIDRLLKILEISSPNHGFILELQSLTTLALSCINNNGNSNRNLEQNISDALKNMKSLQLEDGSFGSEYTTALVLQALIANNEENAKDWNPKSAVQFLSKRQESDGSFGDFLTTFLIIPILNAKSMLNLGNVNCTGSFRRPRDGNMVSDIQSRFGKKIILKYSLYIGDEKDQIHPLLLRTPENITVLELMTLAADIDPKYKFKIHEIQKKKYIYEISDIPNDPVNNRFWIIYQGLNNSTIPIPEQSPDKIKAHEKEHIIMWYKTPDSL